MANQDERDPIPAVCGPAVGSLKRKRSWGTAHVAQIGRKLELRYGSHKGDVLKWTQFEDLASADQCFEFICHVFAAAGLEES